MRLIDADRLKAFLEMARDTGMRIDFNSVIKMIDEQSTVYDVDKVVEQLKLLKQREAEYPTNYTAEDGWGDCEDAYNDGESNGRYSAFSKAIKIVRKGGVE